MKKTRLLFGLFLAVLADVASGILMAHIIRKVSGRYPHMALNTILFYLAGILFTLLPDILDLMKERGLTDIKHKENITHFALIIIPIFILLAILSPFWATFISLCLLCHFIHDSFQSHGSIKWLAPFSQKNIHFIEKVNGKIKLICIWDNHELMSRNMDPHEWLEKYYLRPTVESIISILYFLLIILIVLIW